MDEPPPPDESEPSATAPAGEPRPSPDSSDEPPPAPDAPESSSETCLDCGAKLAGPFCHTCGQRSSTRRLGVSEITSEAWSQITDLDRGFAHTFVGLTLRPGATVQQYLDGRRRTYTGPLRYYLILAAIWLITPTLIGMDLQAVMATETAPAWRSLGVGYDSVWRERLALLVEYRRFANLMTVPVLAVCLSGLFHVFKPRHTFAENVAFSLYASGHALVLTVLVLVCQRLGWSWPIHVLNLIALAYMWWAVTQFTRQAWWKVGLLFSAALVGLSCAAGCALGLVQVALTMAERG